MPLGAQVNYYIIRNDLKLGIGLIITPTATTLQPPPSSQVPCRLRSYSQTCCRRTSLDRTWEMITSSLRRALRSHPAPPSVSRPTTPSIAASLSSQSHQRRQSSSKPPAPPNDGPTSVTNPSVKTVGTPKSKDGTSGKRSGAESRLSRRKIPRERNEQGEDGRDEWTVNLPSVPSTQHVDPKGYGHCMSQLNALSNAHS